MEREERKVALRWIALVIVGVLALFAGVMYKLIKLQVIEPREPDYKARNYSANFSSLGLRGRILDRNGKVLAESVPARMIYADQCDPQFEALPPERQAQIPYELAELMNVDPEVTLEAFDPRHRATARQIRNTNRYTATRKVGILTDEAAIRTLESRSGYTVKASERIAGVSFRSPIAVRAYPNDARMGHLIGYLNAEGKAVAGVEQRFNSYLEGADGKVVALVDSRRRELRDRKRIEDRPAEHGDDVLLTIDNEIQFIIETALSKALETFQANSGIIIVQRVKTGEILGMATLPEFNPKEYRNYKPEEWKNIAVSRNYEPGSVMKPITVAMAMQYGVITENSTFDVGKSGVWYYAGKPLRDHAYGILKPKDILVRSSNIGSAMIGLKMSEPSSRLGASKPNELLWRAFKAIGFGEKTGIEIAGEERGILSHFSRWSKLSPTRMVIGQGISVTAVQLCNAYATIANGGVQMRPTILKEIRTHEGEPVLQNTPEVMGRPLSKEVCDKVIEMMTGMTDRAQNGTAAKAALPSYTVAGKTGTGQIPVNGSYNHSDYNASFVGIYPASNPELVILVTIERPKGPYRMGGSVAAPTFADVAEAIGRYLGLPADKQPKEVQ